MLVSFRAGPGIGMSIPNEPPRFPLVDRVALDAACRRVFDRTSRLVGWGTGSVFDYFHGLWPVRLDYLVDNDASRWGASRHGIEIVPPARLMEESPGKTFVIVYSSAWPEIQAQLAGLGPIPSLPASAVFADAQARRLLDVADELASRPVSRTPRDEYAIVVQGPVVPDVTSRVLRAMSALHPQTLLVLSTWAETPAGVLDEVRPLVDEVVTSTLPVPAGIQNRNCQIVSTAAGIHRAIERGARTILKMRTDLAVLRPDVFEDARWWLSRVDDRRTRGAGLEQRLLIPSSFTRKYLLYHPSDLVMLGSARDLARFWNAPLDPRTGPLLAPHRLDMPLRQVNLEGDPAECYLGLSFCRALGRPAPGSLEDSWNFLRDIFAVVDNDWFEMLWYKNLAVPDSAVPRGIRQTVSHADWIRLQRGTRPCADDPDPGSHTLRLLTTGAG